MADEQQSPTVEVAPTIIISNSDEGGEHVDTANNLENTTDGAGELSSHSDGDAPIDAPSSDIAVAEIEASRDIALAEIGASVERERIAAQSDDGELEECRREIQELRETVATLQEAVALLTLPPVSEVTEEALEIVPEPNLTQPSTAAPTPETMTEPSEESEVESLEVEIPTGPVRRFIAI